MLGIDLGTSTARAQYCTGPDAVAVRVTDPSGGLSSVVSFAVEPPRFGHAALGYLVTDPHRSLRNLRRYLALEGLAAEPGGPSMTASLGDGKVSFALPGGTHSAAELIALWLGELHAQAVRQAGIALNQAVVSFPLAFEGLAHAQLERALARSGLGETSLILEPVAAAVGLCPTGPERDVVIVDVGAAELSACLLHLSEGHVSLPQLVHAEREASGGEAIDALLVARAEEKLGTRFQGPVREMMRQYCQTMKHELSSAASTSCAIPGYLLGRAEGAQLVLDATDLGATLDGLLVLVEAACERLRSTAGLKLGTKVELYLRGGCTRLTGIRSRVEQVFGTPARQSRDPGQSIAHGCALIGGQHGAALREAAHTPRLTLPPLRPIRTSSQPAAMTQVEVRAPRAPAVPSDLARLAAEAEAGGPLESNASPARSPSQPARAPSQPARAASEPARAPSQAVRAERAPSQPLITNVSQSVAPAGPSRTSIAPSDLKGGAVRNAITATQFLALPLSRPPTPQDMDPVSLPLLFMVLRHPSRFGTLNLQMNGQESLRFQVADGMAFLSGMEHKRVLEAFRIESGRYTLEVKPYKEQPNKEAHMMMSLLVDGMKETVKRFESEAMVSALGDKIKLAPFVGPRNAKLITKLPLLPMEQRIVKYTFNGQEAIESTLEHLGVRRQSTLGLMLLLSVYGLIEWHEPPEVEEVSLEDALNARAAEMAEANYFQVLGLHWSALDEEVDQAYEKLLNELGPDQPVHAAAPAACERMLQRLHEAYDLLSDETRRAHYRRQAYPDLDMSAVADFLRKKEASWALRSDGAAEVEKLRRSREALKRRRKPQG